MLFGWAWHSPLLFINQWMKLAEIPKPEVITPEMKKKMMKSMVLGLLSSIILAGVLACLLVKTNATGIIESMMLAVWVWLGFVVTTLASGPLWEGKSVKLFLFNSAYYLCAILVSAIALALFN